MQKHNLVGFFDGTEADYKGRKFSEILKMTDDQLEKSHDIVQCIFPLKEKSMHNPDAPIITDEEIQQILSSEKGKKNLSAAADRFFSFLSQDGCEKPFWVRPFNHNYLRITRVIKCYKLFGMDDISERFYDLAADFYDKFPTIIGKKTFKFWSDALAGD